MGNLLGSIITHINYKQSLDYTDESVARPVFFNDFSKVKQAAQRSKAKELAQSKIYERRIKCKRKIICEKHSH